MYDRKSSIVKLGGVSIVDGSHYRYLIKIISILLLFYQNLRWKSLLNYQF